MLLCSLFVRYRDVAADLGGPLAGAVLRLAGPVRHDDGPRDLPAHLCRSNPLAALFTQMRHAIVDPTAPRPQTRWGAERLLIPAGSVVFAVALGWWVFRRETPRIAENL